MKRHLQQSLDYANQTNNPSRLLLTIKKISSSTNSILYHYGGKVLNRSKAFEILVSKAFNIIDIKKNGKIEEVELYAGLLLVHLNLAKYAGPAACYPPSRTVCHNLFIKADVDHSNGIDRNEFQYIIGIMCAQIVLRILVYYVVLILFVPIVASYIVTLIDIQRGTYLELCTNQIVSISLFFIAIPLLWNYIDECYATPIETSSSIDNCASNNNDVDYEGEMLPLQQQSLEEQQRRRRRKLQKQDEIEAQT